MLGEQHEKPDDLLDNYFLPGEDDFEVQHHLPVQQSYKREGWGRRKMILRRESLLQKLLLLHLHLLHLLYGNRINKAVSSMTNQNKAHAFLHD